MTQKLTVPPHVIAAVERSISGLDALALRLAEQGSYDAGFFEGDADSLRWLLERLTPELRQT